MPITNWLLCHVCGVQRVWWCSTESPARGPLTSSFSKLFSGLCSSYRVFSYFLCTPFNWLSLSNVSPALAYQKLAICFPFCNFFVVLVLGFFLSPFWLTGNLRFYPFLLVCKCYVKVQSERSIYLNGMNFSFFDWWETKSSGWIS